MYFIIQGDCIVNIIEHNRREYQAVKLLVEGSYFGEIGCIYECKRTASVASRHYNIQARLTIERLREFLSNYPDFRDHMKKHIYGYNYGKKKFLQEILENAPFFENSNLTTEQFHILIYNIKE